MKRSHSVSIAWALILFGVIVRLLPHAPNATPMTAIALVSSLYLGKRCSIILPLATLLLSDVIIGLYDVKIMLSVYGSFALIGCLSWINKRYRSLVSIEVSAIGGSLLFFLITNGAVWLFSPWYEKTVSGLLYSYELGLPFWRNMLLGDIVYTTILIGIFEIAYRKRNATPTRIYWTSHDLDTPGTHPHHSHERGMYVLNYSWGNVRREKCWICTIAGC